MKKQALDCETVGKENVCSLKVSENKSQYSRVEFINIWTGEVVFEYFINNDDMNLCDDELLAKAWNDFNFDFSTKIVKVEGKNNGNI